MVDIARFFTDFCQKESCGKCSPCRIGTRRMLEILNRITDGNGEPEDIDRLQRLGEMIRETSLCGLGQTAPNPVLSTLRWFRDEYEAHIHDRRCPAGACRKLLTYRIDAQKCKGCTVCATNCPAGAIVGERKSPHAIVLEKCVRCGACSTVCRFDAVVCE